MSTLGMYTTGTPPARAKIESLSETLFHLVPNTETPIFALLGTISAQETDLGQQTFSWFQEAYTIPKGAVATAVPATARLGTSDITTLEPSVFIPSSMLLNERTMEIMRVVALEGTTVRVVRGHGSSEPAAMIPGDVLVQVGAASEEASMRVTPRSQSFGELSNQTQIVRKAWAVTGSAAALDLRFQTAAANSQAAMAQDFSQAMETILVFGERSTTQSNGQPLRTTDGLISFIRKYAPENMSALGGQITYEGLEGALEPMFQWRSDAQFVNDRVLWTSLEGMKLVNALGRAYGEVQMSEASSRFGHKFREITTTVGNVKFMHHSMFDQYHHLKYSFLCVDPGSLRIKYLRGRKEIKSNVGANGKELFPESGMDAMGGDMLSEFGLQCTTPQTNGMIAFAPGWKIAKKEIITLSDVFYVSIASPDECDIAEPKNAQLDPNTGVVITLTGGKPGTQVMLNTPAGIIPMTVAGDGTATVAANVGTGPTWSAFITPTAATQNTIFIKSAVSFCVKQPCDGDDPLVINPCQP